MTPRVINFNNDEKLEMIKQVESSRMSYCLADILNIHGDVGLSPGNGLWGPAASPIIYPPDFVSEKWRWFLKLNPLTGIIEGYRNSLFGHSAFDWRALAISTVMTLALLVYAAYAFRRTEDTFADII